MIELLRNLPATLAVAMAWVLVLPSRRIGRIVPTYRPVALLLTVNLFADVGGFTLRALVLTGQHRPYVGVARLAYHAEQACFLAWPVGFCAVAMVTVARRRPWPAVVAGACSLALRIAAYPWLRGLDRLGPLLLLEQVAAVAVGAWSLGQMHRHGNPLSRARGLPRPDPLPQELAVMVLLAVEVTKLVTFCGPLLVDFCAGRVVSFGGIFKFYCFAQLAYSLAFLWLAFMQWRWRWRNS